MPRDRHTQAIIKIANKYIAEAREIIPFPSTSSGLSQDEIIAFSLACDESRKEALSLFASLCYLSAPRTKKSYFFIRQLSNRIRHSAYGGLIAGDCAEIACYIFLKLKHAQIYPVEILGVKSKSTSDDDPGADHTVVVVNRRQSLAAFARGDDKDAIIIDGWANKCYTADRILNELIFTKKVMVGENLQNEAVLFDPHIHQLKIKEMATSAGLPLDKAAKYYDRTDRFLQTVKTFFSQVVLVPEDKKANLMSKIADFEKTVKEDLKSISEKRDFQETMNAATAVADILEPLLEPPTVPALTSSIEQVTTLNKLQTGIKNVMRSVEKLPSHDSWKPNFILAIIKLFYQTHTFEKFEKISPPLDSEVRDMGWFEGGGHLKEVSSDSSSGENLRGFDEKDATPRNFRNS